MQFDVQAYFEKTIAPKSEAFFYVLFLLKSPNNGTVRTELVPENNQWKYKVEIKPYGKTAFKCGSY